MTVQELIDELEERIDDKNKPVRIYDTYDSDAPLKIVKGVDYTLEDRVDLNVGIE